VLAAEAGAAFVKTAVGFDGIAPTREDVWLMKVAVEGYRWGEEVKVK
jgi:deoxyribose-phosphate aldolase